MTYKPYSLAPHVKQVIEQVENDGYEITLLDDGSLSVVGEYKMFGPDERLWESLSRYRNEIRRYLHEQERYEIVRNMSDEQRLLRLREIKQHLPKVEEGIQIASNIRQEGELERDTLRAEIQIILHLMVNK